MNDEEIIFNTLHSASHEAFIVGGAVRDSLIGLPGKDIDFSSSATPEQVTEIFEGAGFKVIPTGIDHGTVTVMINERGFEITTFRADKDHDGRHCKVSFVTSLQEDMKRRDFTINALAKGRDGEIIDFVGGMSDIQNKIIRSVGNPIERFSEDFLRMMRAVRFAAQKGFMIESETFSAITKLSSNLAQISRERIRDELTKILLSKGRVSGVENLIQTGMMKVIIPEFEKLVEVDQPPEFHPEGDVLTHTLLAIGHVEGDIELMLAVLLHDIGKAKTQGLSKTGRITFENHHNVSAQMAEEIMRDLKFPVIVIEDVVWIIRHHMVFHQDVSLMKKSTIKNMILSGEERFDKLMRLLEADIQASNGDFENFNLLLKRVTEMKDELDKKPLVKLITGNDLMAMGFKPSPQMAIIMNAIRNQQLEGQISTRDEAISFVQEQFMKNKI